MIKRSRKPSSRLSSRFCSSVTVGLAVFLAVVAVFVRPGRTYRATYRIADSGGESAEPAETKKMLIKLLRQDLGNQAWIEKVQRNASAIVGTTIPYGIATAAFASIQLVEGDQPATAGITLSLSGPNAKIVNGLLRAVAEQLASDAEEQSQSLAREALSRSKSEARAAQSNLESSQTAIQTFMKRFRSAEHGSTDGHPAVASPSESPEAEDAMWAEFEKLQRDFQQAALRVKRTSEAERKAWIATFEAPYFAVEARGLEEQRSAASSRIPWSTSLLAGILAVLAGGGAAVAGESGASVIRSLDQAREVLSIPIAGVISMAAFPVPKHSIPRARQWTAIVVGLAEWFLVFCVLIVAGNATLDADFRGTLLTNPLEAFHEALTRFGNWLGLG